MISIMDVYTVKYHTRFTALIFTLLCMITLNLLPQNCAANPQFAWEFDGNKAFEHLTRQADMGPRIPGFSGHRKCSDYIAEHVKASSCTVEIQRFSAQNPLLRRTLPYENIIAFFDTPSTSAIAISAHWDTRPHADQDHEESNRRIPIIGANDGASGVAVLLELARIFKKNPPPVDVWFLFFDAEDSGTPQQISKYCLGSQYFVKNMPENFDILVGINVDMVADKNLKLQIERNSLRNAQEYVRDFWGVGTEKFPDVFQKQLIPPIYDDHVPFIEAGIPYFNIIDLDYKYWHTVDDTAENCSAESLDIVGKTIALWVFTSLEKKVE